VNAIYLYRLSHWFYKKNIPILPVLIRNIIFLIYNSYIPASAEIGKGSIFAYGAIGVVVHAKAKIGKGCVIGQGVTIGASEGFFSKKEQAAPQIGDNCYISAGAKILGNIIVSGNSIIGAGAIVLRDIPPHAITVGCPAKVVGNTPIDYLAISP